MTSDWQKIKIKDVAESINTGLDAIRRAPIVNYPTPIQCLRIQDISQNKSIKDWGFTEIKDNDYEKYRLRKGDIIIARTSNSIGVNYFVESNLNAVFNNGLARLRVKTSKIDSNYLFYIFKDSSFINFIKSISCGTSAQPNLKVGDLTNYEFELPPLEKQKSIVEILKNLDKKIEINKKTNETLEQIAKSLFKSWFIDFDPVRAKAEGRSTGLPDEISNLFPDSFEDSEIGEIPSNWRNISISKLIEINPTRKISKDTVAPFLEMKCVPTSGHTAKGVYDREFTSGTKFQQGDTLLARITPCLENGKTAMVDFLDEGQIGWGSTEFIVLCGKEKMHNPFVYYLSRSEIFRQYAIRNMVGSSGRQRVPNDSLYDFNIANPPIILINLFSEIASSILQKITTGSQEIISLEKIRNTLLPKLISGELIIPDTEKMIEEVGI